MSKQLVRNKTKSKKQQEDENISFFGDVPSEELTKMEMASGFKQYIFDFNNGLTEVIA